MNYKIIKIFLFSFSILISSTQTSEHYNSEDGYLRCFAQKSQNFFYQVMAKTSFWDPMMSGFKAGRVIAINELDIQPNDRLLFVGEGTGLDFEVLPENFNRTNLQAFDFSPEMVRQAKLKASKFNIPEQNVFIGDAQNLPFIVEKFDKIYFPLSLGSIPNPTIALKEAERVLEKMGRIVVMEKLLDDGYQASYFRLFLNFFTRFIFADINRNLTQIMGDDTNLKIVHYHSLDGKLSGILGRFIGSYYRICMLVRTEDYPNLPAIKAVLNQQKKNQ